MYPEKNPPTESAETRSNPKWRLFTQFSPTLPSKVEGFVGFIGIFALKNSFMVILDRMVQVTLQRTRG